MPGQSLRLTKEMILAMCKVTIEEASFEPIVKEKYLIVDSELYGLVPFPISMVLGRGQKLKFPGYGEVQVKGVTMDQLVCTREIDERLYDEFVRNPPEPDPTPPIRPARVVTAPTGLLPDTSDGSLASVESELASTRRSDAKGRPLDRAPDERVSCPPLPAQPCETAAGAGTVRRRLGTEAGGPRAGIFHPVPKPVRPAGLFPE